MTIKGFAYFAVKSKQLYKNFATVLPVVRNQRHNAINFKSVAFNFILSVFIIIKTLNVKLKSPDYYIISTIYLIH